MYSSLKRIGIQFQGIPVTIRDHIRKKRLEQELLQENVSEIIGVTTDCITNWEMNRAVPQIQFMPAIIQFLGYIPIEIDTCTLSGQILLFRNQHGLSHKNLGKLIGVDGSSVSSWEKGEGIPYLFNLEKLKNLFIEN